jgi:hypothetical protein
MKNATESAPSKMISAPTIVVLVVGVALIAYMFIQPMFAPKDNPPAVAPGAANSANQIAAKAPGEARKIAPDNAAANNRASVRPGVGAAPLGQGDLSPTEAALIKDNRVELISDRDPFIPSGVIARAVAAAQPKTENPMVAPPGPPPKVETVIAKALPAIKPEVIPKDKPVHTPTPVQFIWKGIIGGFGPQQVVLIQHNARTYILHQGDPVPGTNYIVAEVTPETVLLTSPSDQLRLSKKKEAKING